MRKTRADKVRERLRRIAKAKGGSHPGLAIHPRHAMNTRGRSLLDYAHAYFRGKVRVPFSSPLAAQFEFEVEEPLQVKVPSRDRYDLVAAIQDELSHLHLFLSNFLTHPRYGEEKQVGFSRGDTLRPIRLREIERGVFSFRVRGTVVGRRDMFKFLRGPNKAGAHPERQKPVPPGSLRVFIAMPTRPDAPEVGWNEWYSFRPSKWTRKHPTIPLRQPPISILLTPSAAPPAIVPQYDRLYHDGLVRIALLFGYDDKHHLTADDAREVYKIITAPPSRRFTTRDSGPYGYHGPGLGFSDPTHGNFRKLNFDGTTVFRRDSASGAGPIAVRYRLLSGPLQIGERNVPEGEIFVDRRLVRHGEVIPQGTLIDRALRAEIRLYNFDKAAPGLSTDELIGRFVSVFKNNDFIHYDGHANYGGGFYIGEQEEDILWADDIGEYAQFFNRDYQIFSIGACHSAGYFADLFYNELRPEKSPRNLDIIAAVNETDFEDAVQQAMELIRALLQIKRAPRDDPPDYARVLREVSYPASFQAFIGVFGHPQAESH